MFALSAALAALPGWLARRARPSPRAATLVIASTCCTGDAVQAGSSFVLETFSPEHVLASFNNGAEDGIISLFADWSAHEWQAVKRFLPDGHRVATVVLTEEPDLAVASLRGSGRSCAVFPASLAELQPLMRIFSSFDGLAARHRLTA